MIYLDNSATTLRKPKEVYSEIIRVMNQSGGNPGRGGHKMSVKASDVIFKARENVCKLFNISNESRVCFTHNASTALNFAIKGILDAGDHVIISPFEHNSVYRPVNSMLSSNVEMSIIKSDEEGNFDNPEKYIKKNTKLIIINHVSNVTGNIANIKKISEIAHKNNILFMIDASQSAGHIDIDVEKDNIDILACAGHKGLFGPQGTGILYIANGIQTKTIIEGGTGSFSELSYQPFELPDRFETGTLNTPGIGGLSKGIEFILNKKISNVRKHEESLIKQLIRGLSSIKSVEVYGNNDFKRTSGSVAFNVKDFDSVSFCGKLDEKYDIMLRGGLHCSYLAHKTIKTLDRGCVRASVSFFTSVDEINYLLNVIDKIRK